MYRYGQGLAAACLLLGMALPAAAQTRVVMLGTGTPVPDSHRAGQSVAVVHDDKAYVFDLGDGAIRNAIRASQDMGIEALSPTRIDRVFFTHLHSDHMLDYPALLNTYWWRRDHHVEVYGPPGIEAMSQGVYQMLAPDIAARKAGNQPISDPAGYRANTHAFRDNGVVLAENGVRISAFKVSHGEVKPAFGYRIETPDKTIVLSGDTAYDPHVAAQARDADILIHEAASQAGLSALPAQWQRYHHAAHTPSDAVARIANQARPDKLILVHNLFYGADEKSTLTEVRKDYEGDVVLANDLDVFE
ncbi:MBL fold metallo-hydrolase [Salinisphaera sp. Q1T1-3]|nr:MBL fold metallo-hydrolase [Salinisphaera sp. Q1T1-3]